MNNSFELKKQQKINKRLNIFSSKEKNILIKLVTIFHLKHLKPIIYEGLKNVFLNKSNEYRNTNKGIFIKVLELVEYLFLILRASLKVFCCYLLGDIKKGRDMFFINSFYR